MSVQQEKAPTTIDQPSDNLVHWVNKETKISICGRNLRGRPSVPNYVEAVKRRGICGACETAYLEMCLRWDS